MAKGIYNGVDNIARNVKKIYVGKTEKLEVLDYIESSGTQYIDTGIVPNQDTKIEIDLQSTTSSTSNVYIGGRQAFQSNAFYISQQYGDSGEIGIRYAYGTKTVDIPDTYQNINRNTFILNKTLAYMNDTLVNTFPTQTFTSPVTLWLFACNNNGILLQPALMKLYSCKIYDNDVLVRDYIPVKTDTGVVCLYDKVSQKKFLNRGTGMFIAGEKTGEVITLENKARKVKRGYIGVEGFARLFFVSMYPTYIKNLSRQLSLGYTSFGALKNYIICTGGRDSTGVTTASVEGFNKNGVHYTLTSLTQQRERHACGSIGDCVLAIGGVTATSASSGRLTATVETYNNSLVKGTASSLTYAAFDFNVSANDTHLIQAGGTRYSATTNQAQSYDTNLVKTSITNLSESKQFLTGGNVGEFILFIGGIATNSYVDIYDNNNIHTTIARPSIYPNTIRSLASASTNTKVFFFGGQQGTATTYYNTLLVFDDNLVQIVATLPLTSGIWNAFNVGEEYVVGDVSKNACIYNNDIVLEKYITTDSNVGSYMGRASASNDEFAITGGYGTNTSLFNF